MTTSGRFKDNVGPFLILANAAVLLAQQCTETTRGAMDHRSFRSRSSRTSVMDQVVIRRTLSIPCSPGALGSRKKVRSITRLNSFTGLHGIPLDIRRHLLGQ